MGYGLQTINEMQIYELRPIRQKFELFYRGIVYENKSHVYGVNTVGLISYID